MILIFVLRKSYYFYLILENDPHPHTPLKDKFFLVFRPHFEQFFLFD